MIMKVKKIIGGGQQVDLPCHSENSYHLVSQTRSWLLIIKGKLTRVDK